MTRFGACIAGVLMVTGALAAQASPVPGILPSGFGESVDRDIAKIRDATLGFRTTEAAEKAGYRRDGDCMEYQPKGAMGYHLKNDALLDATLDVEHPEVLVYEKMPDGSFKLNGVEFIVPISAWTAAEPPRVMGQALKKVDRAGIWYLHAWVWEPSPSGLFADWNPNVKCLR